MSSRRTILSVILPVIVVGALCLVPAHGRSKSSELTFSDKAFAKLDTFEGLNLQDADKLFGKKDYKGAYAAYKAFSFEFDKSKALPYVLFRVGRCLHNLEKRNAAVKAYQDVVDYFPDDVRFAAAALYYIGECHRQNGDTAKQTAVWARLVKDDEYVGQPNSGTALAFLGSAMAKLGKHDEATEYNWRTAVAFRKSNYKAAETAKKAVIHHYALRKPNHEKLKQFYSEISGWDFRGNKTDKPQADSRYWKTVFDAVARNQASLPVKKKSASYWTAKMGGAFADNDGLRKQHADLTYLVSGDRSVWFATLEKQFAGKPKSIGRVLQWCGHYSFDKKVKSAFFAKHGQPMVQGMNTKEKIELMHKLNSSYGLHDEVKSILLALDIRDLDDSELASLGHFAARFVTEEDVMRYFARLKDKLFASKQRFKYHNSRSKSREHAEKALAEISVLEKSPKHAGGLAMSKAKLLRSLGQYPEAIKAYRAANKQPDSTWGVTDCMVAMKNYGGAIQTMQQLEGLGGGVAAQAAMKIADIYRTSGNKGKEVQQLRVIMRRYPKSRQSSDAHNRLERYGVALTGGEAVAED